MKQIRNINFFQKELEIFLRMIISNYLLDPPVIKADGLAECKKTAKVY
jgi:hypothetical protein